MAIDPDEAIEKMYYFELERQRSLYRQLSIPNGVLVVDGSILIYFLQNYNFSLDTGPVFFVGFIFLATVAFSFALGFAFRSLIAYEERRIDSPSEWSNHADDLGTGKRGAFSSQMRRSMAEAATTLRRANDQRQNSLYYAYRALMLAVGTTLAAGIPYFIQSLG